MCLCHQAVQFGTSQWACCSATGGGNRRPGGKQCQPHLHPHLPSSRPLAHKACNGSLPPGLWLRPPAGWPPRTGISSGTHPTLVLHTGLLYFTLGCEIWKIEVFPSLQVAWLRYTDSTLDIADTRQTADWLQVKVYRLASMSWSRRSSPVYIYTYEADLEATAVKYHAH